MIVGLFLAVLSVVGFAATFVFGAALTKRCGVDPLVLSFLRFAIASSVMLAPAAATPHGRARLLAPTKADWRRMLWLGPVGTSLMAWCVFLGTARVSAANASMADALTPLMIFAVGALRVRRIEPREIFGLACGFVGALLVIQVVHAGGVALEAYSLGDVFILLAAATWGVYSVYGRDVIARVGSSVFTGWTMLLGAVSVGVFLPFLDVAWPRDAMSWALVAGLGLVSTLMPFWTWNAAMKHLPMSVLGISAYFTPVVTMGLGIVFLGEAATPLQWLGTAFIAASAVVETSRCKGAEGLPRTVRKEARA